MPTRKRRVSETVVQPLFFLIICALLDTSDQILSKPTPEECFRGCLARSQSSITKVFSCYHKCLNRTKKGTENQALLKNNPIRRTRKALVPNPDCPDSSPGQSADWRPIEVNVSFGQYQDTSYWYANVSWTPINETYGNWTGIMVQLVITHSSPIWMTHINCSVYPINQTFLRINISSYHYTHPGYIFLNVLAVPFSPKQDISESLSPFKPDIPTSPTLSATTPTSSTLSATTTITRPWIVKQTKGCSFSEGDLVWYPKRVGEVFSQINNNSWYANISWTPLTDPAATWNGYLITIIAENIDPSLSYSDAPECFKLPKSQAFFIVNSSQGWKYSSSISINVTAYPRPKRESADMVTFYPIKRRTWPKPKLPDPTTSATPSPPSKPDVVQIVFLSVGGLFLLPIVVLLLRWRRRKLQSKKTRGKRTPKCFKYHAFIIYSMFDSEFVNNILIPTLESYNFKVCVHWRDFLPGRVFAESIVESVYNSFKIIAVVSNNFISSNGAHFEIQHTIKRLMDNRDDCLIVIKFDEEGVDRLPDTILDRSYIDFTNPQDKSTWESRLVDILRKGIIEEDEIVRDTANANNNNNKRTSQSSSTDNEERTLIANV